MAAFCGVFPILQGKSQAARDFAKALMGPRAREFDASEKRLGATKETWFLQKVPQGDMWLVYFEAADIGKVFEDFAHSQDPFDRWSKDQVKAITGVDLNQPAPGPTPEQMLTYGY